MAAELVQDDAKRDAQTRASGTEALVGCKVDSVRSLRPVTAYASTHLDPHVVDLAYACVS